MPSRRDRKLTNLPEGLLPRHAGAVRALESATREQIADDNDREQYRDADVMLEARLAAIRGEMDWGGYGHDALVGGASGGAGGAVVGGLAGAGVGALGGTLGGVFQRAGGDLWYQYLLKSGRTGDIAAFQAGDLVDRVSKMLEYADYLTPQEKTLISDLAANYKKYIDAVVRDRKEADSKNLFYQPAQRTSFLSTGKIRRLADANQDPYAGEQTSLFQNYYDSAKGLAQGGALQGAADKAAQGVIDPQAALKSINPQSIIEKWKSAQVPPEAASAADSSLMGTAESGAADAIKNPSKLMGGLKTLGTGLAGMGVGMAAGAATEWALKQAEIAQAGGASNVVSGFMTDIGRMLGEINKVSAAFPQARQAGDQLWTLLSRYTNPQFVAERKRDQAMQENQQALAMRPGSQPNMQKSQPALADASSSIGTPSSSAPITMASGRGRKIVRESRVQNRKVIRLQFGE